MLQSDCADSALLVKFPRAGGMQGVFQTSVQFMDQGTGFVPDQSAVLDVLNANTLEGTVGVMQAAPRLLFMRCFSHYLEGKPAGLSPAVIIRSMTARASYFPMLNCVLLVQAAMSICCMLI